MKEEGLVFVVRRVEADYIAPAKFDNELEIVPEIEKLTPARMVLRQSVLRHKTILFQAFVTIVAMDEAGKPQRLPAKIREIQPK